MTDGKPSLIFDRVLAGYHRQIENETFNGIKLQEVDQGIDPETLNSEVRRLVDERKIDVISSETQLNPHIKRHPPWSISKQLEKLNIGERYHTCLYPTPETIAAQYDLGFLDSKPFTKALAAGSEQLKPVFFELGVLDRYRLDPRYLFHCSEYSGRISMMSESKKTGPIPDRDQTFIETFGMGVDRNENAVVCVYLRYLSLLSPEHQRFWETFTSHAPASMHENYYRPTLLGEFWENNSAISAIRISIAAINKICETVWGKRLFVSEVPVDVHHNLSPFMRATKSDYLSFAHELDKLVSENLNANFFDGKVERTVLKRHPDGTTERKSHGTLVLLEKWLFEGEMTWEKEAEARQEIIGVFRQIRKERQPAAHAVVQNEFDPIFITHKRKLLLDAAFALGNMLFMLARHPRAPAQRIPKFLEEARIEAW
jgi:hypothetical protein